MGQLRCLVVAAHPLGLSLRLPPAGVTSVRSPLLKTDGRQPGRILASHTFSWFELPKTALGVALRCRSD
jgi:hypothetical protein